MPGSISSPEQVVGLHWNCQKIICNKPTLAISYHFSAVSYCTWIWEKKFGKGVHFPKKQHWVVSLNINFVSLLDCTGWYRFQEEIGFCVKK